MLTRRQTRLKFGDHLSDLFEVLNGTMQGCLIAMLLYTFYNVLLICIADNQSKNKLTSGFIDNSMFLATAKTLTNCHAILADMMHRTNRGFD